MVLEVQQHFVGVVAVGALVFTPTIHWQSGKPARLVTKWLAIHEHCYSPGPLGTEYYYQVQPSNQVHQWLLVNSRTYARSH